MSRTCLALILAAGEGTRMRSSIPKVMHPIAGTPMLHHVIEAAVSSGCEEIAVVVGNGAKLVSDFVSSVNPTAQIFEQRERLGTAHAALAARQALEAGADDLLVLFGDTALVTAETLKSIRDRLADGAAVCVLGFKAADPTGYGRLIEQNGQLQAIREHKEASASELDIDFCNGGIMGLSGTHALGLLDAIDNKNAKGEFYLTDVVEIANHRGLSVTTVEAPETEVLGVNNQAELAEVERLWQDRKREELMLSGVTMSAPETVFMAWDTNIEPGVQIEQNVVFAAEVSVRAGARVRAFSHLEGAEIGENAVVGPYARLRPGSQLAAGAKVGNFVETKNAVIAEGAKVNHLTYIGDAEIGAAANIGAGTITCNYDGINKHLTRIGSGAFIGSNSALVAPVSIGDNAYVASGSVITEDVPDSALGIGRGKQATKEGYADIIRKRNADLKNRKR